MAVGSLTGYALGFALVLPPVFLGAPAAGHRYLAFRIISIRTIPCRLGVFLDWCCDAGLMRTEGISYQFPHRELQAWFAELQDQ